MSTLSKNRPNIKIAKIEKKLLEFPKPQIPKKKTKVKNKKKKNKQNLKIAKI